MIPEGRYLLRRLDLSSMDCYFDVEALKLIADLLHVRHPLRSGDDREPSRTGVRTLLHLVFQKRLPDKARQRDRPCKREKPLIRVVAL